MSQSRKGRVTIQDVAQRAGVTKTTVSHAISGKRPVAKETRERVFAAMWELSFRPNPLARRLAGGSGHAIALVFPLASPSLSAVELRFIHSIAEVVNRSPYSLLTLSSPRVETSDLQQMIVTGLVEGIILMRIDLVDERVNLLQREDVPFVMVGRTVEHQGLPFVDLDSATAMDIAFEHLRQFGHTQIAFIHPDDTNFGFAYRLLEGHRQACERRGLDVIAEPAALSDEAGRRAVSNLLDRRPGVTAIIVWSDVVTVGVLRALHDRHLQVPTDISLISFDRSDQLRLASSDLTIIDTRADEVGARAARMLLDFLDRRLTEPGQVLVAPRLVVGQSTGPPRNGSRHSPVPAAPALAERG